MAARCRHPRLAARACRVYGLALWLYPPSLRREFHHELIVTFRNRAEDVLNTGSVAAAVLFIIHLAADWLRTFTFEVDEPPPMSLLGLNGGDAPAYGCLDRTTFTGSLLLATLGVVLLVGGWYGWLSMMTDLVRAHRLI